MGWPSTRARIRPTSAARSPSSSRARSERRSILTCDGYRRLRLPAGAQALAVADRPADLRPGVDLADGGVPDVRHHLQHERRDGAAGVRHRRRGDVLHRAQLHGDVAGVPPGRLRLRLHPRHVRRRCGIHHGWAVILDYLLSPALIYIGAAVAIDAVLPGLPIEAWGLGLLAINTVINLRGIDSVTRTNTGLLLLQLASLALFLIFAAVAVARGTAGAHLSLQPFFNAHRIAPDVVLGAVSVGVLNYLGFDQISTLAEAARGGPSLVARATLLTLVVTAVLFVSQSYLASLFVLKLHAFPAARRVTPGS